MKESKNCWTISSLKDEINMRYNFMRYKKLHKKLLCNIIEKHNVQLLYETLEDLKADFN